MRLRARASRSNAETAEVAEKIRLCVLCGLCVLFVGAAACGGTAIFRQYEYEEDVYLSLDGTATVYVNSSLAALNALRGTSFDATPTARVDTAAIRAYYTSPTTRVTRIAQSRRNGRRYVHDRLDVDDVRRLGDHAGVERLTIGTNVGTLLTDYDWILDVELPDPDVTKAFLADTAYADAMRSLAGVTKHEWTARMSHTMHGL